MFEDFSQPSWPPVTRTNVSMFHLRGKLTHPTSGQLWSHSPSEHLYTKLAHLDGEHVGSSCLFQQMNWNFSSQSQMRLQGRRTQGSGGTSF